MFKHASALSFWLVLKFHNETEAPVWQFQKPGAIQRMRPSETESETEASAWQFYKPNQIQRAKPSKTESETEAPVLQFYKFRRSDHDLLYYYLKAGMPETTARQPI